MILPQCNQNTYAVTVADTTLTVDQVQALQAKTNGVITATILTTETVTELATLNGTNALTIVIRSQDATGATAAQLNTINDATSVAVDLTNVTALASSSLSDLGTLATAITNNEFQNDTGLTTIAVSDSTIDATTLAARIDSFDTINGSNTTGMTLASGATINVDADEVDHMLADETASRLTISDQVITVTNAITVDQANLLGATTTGVVTATIATTETVTELATLNADGGTNALTVVVRAADATGATAAQLNTINDATSVAVDLTNVTALAASSLSDLGTLATAITNNEFQNDTGLTTIAVSDTTVDATTLAARIDSYDTINGGSTTNMTLASRATINVDADEITHMLADETAGRLTISDQKITVTNAITVDTANLLGATTTGVVTATIATTETITELATLSADGGTNALTIVIRSQDATGATAAQLNAINDATSVAVDLTNVTALAASSQSDLETLATAITNNEFQNDTGLTTIAVSDTSVDATTLASTIDSYDTINGSNTTGKTLASGSTINVDASEITEMLADESAGRLTISDQAITVTGAITVDTANLLGATTTGVVTATIATTETITELATLSADGGTNASDSCSQISRCNWSNCSSVKYD